MLVEQGDFAEARLRNTELLGAMVTQGQAQFLVAAQLIELVCDADQGRWKQWSIRFSMVETLLRESGQVHRDLQMLAYTAHGMAIAQGQNREAEQAGALAEGQRLALARD